MKYLLLEVPMFLTAFLLGLYGGDVFDYSIIAFIIFLILLYIFYMFLVYLSLKYTEEAPEKEIIEEIKNPIIEPEALDKKIVHHEYDTSTFKVLRSLSLNGVPITTDTIVCRVNMKENYVEIVNADNYRIELNRFNSFVELSFIKLIK